MQKSIFFSLTVIFSLILAACSQAATTGQEPAMEHNMEQMEAKEESAGMAAMGNGLPQDLDTATEKMSEQGHFQVSITSNMNPPDINQIHSWTLHLETPDGQPVEGATISIDGGMPQHNHGFPTSPEVTQDLGKGDYLVEGVRFNMTGWWEMKFAIEAGGQTDTVTFNLVIETGQ